MKRAFGGYKNILAFRQKQGGKDPHEDKLTKNISFLEYRYRVAQKGSWVKGCMGGQGLGATRVDYQILNQ